MGGDRDGVDGQWSGGFDTLREAVDFAKTTPDEEPRFCIHCRPDMAEASVPPAFKPGKVDFDTLRGEFEDVYMKGRTLFLPGLTFDDMQAKIPSLRRQALKGSFHKVVFNAKSRPAAGNMKKRPRCLPYILAAILLVLVIALIILLPRSCGAKPGVTGPSASPAPSAVTTTEPTTPAAANPEPTPSAAASPAPRPR